MSSTLLTKMSQNNDYSNVGKVLDGREFNRIYKNDKFVRLLNESKCHHGFQYKEGLNIDTEDFYPHESACPGGLYFCDKSEYEEWLDYSYSVGEMKYFSKVIIPDDAKIYIEYGKYLYTNLFTTDFFTIGS